MTAAAGGRGRGRPGALGLHRYWPGGAAGLPLRRSRRAKGHPGCATSVRRTWCCRTDAPPSRPSSSLMPPIRLPRPPSPGRTSTAGRGEGAPSCASARADGRCPPPPCAPAVTCATLSLGRTGPKAESDVPTCPWAWGSLVPSVSRSAHPRSTWSRERTGPSLPWGGRWMPTRDRWT